MTLGEKIKLARNQKKISQQKLGDLSNTHQKNVSKYEKDLVIPSAVTLKKMADVLEVTTDYLLGSEQENEVIKDTTLVKYFKEVDKMPSDLKGALMTIMESCIRDFKAKQAFGIQQG